MKIIRVGLLGSFVKLIACLLVFGILFNEGYAITCTPPQVDNGNGRCITPIKKIEGIEADEIRFSCKTNPNQVLCNKIDKQTGKPYKDGVDPQKYTDYQSCLLNNRGNEQRCVEIKNDTKLGQCLKSGYSDAYCECKLTLKGVYLNTEVPFVGKGLTNRCLVGSDGAEAPTTVLRSLTKILMTFVMIGGFGMIVWSGVLMASSGSDDKRFTQGKDMLQSVAIAFALLGSLGVILRFINPNFFT